MPPTVAYVHDWIVFLGWAEEVLRMLIRKYGSEDAKIFTLFSPRKSLSVDEEQIPIVTALPRRCNQLIWWWNTQRWLKRLFDYRNLMPLYPLLCRLLRKKIEQADSDLLVISSFAAAKNVVEEKDNEKNRGKKKVILYLHSPMQYIRENHDEYLQKIRGAKGAIFKRVTRYLRKWDKRSRHYDEVFANSKYTAVCAKKYYHLEATVWYPEMPEVYRITDVIVQPRDYFVYVGRLVRFIREVDRIIELANLSKVPLLILGSWPDEDCLKSLAWPTVIFVWQVDDLTQKIDILKQARGLINLAKESCGMATMEALALGVPVFGYDDGGTIERIDDSNWVLVWSKDIETLTEQMKIFLAKKRDRTRIQANFREKMNYKQ